MNQAMSERNERDNQIKDAISKIVKACEKGDLVFEFTESGIEIWAEDKDDLWAHYCDL